LGDARDAGGAGLYRPAMHRPPWGLDDPRPADYEIRSRIEDIRADALFRMRGLPDVPERGAAIEAIRDKAVERLNEYVEYAMRSAKGDAALLASAARHEARVVKIIEDLKDPLRPASGWE
jgi:hypothetical protein